MQVKELKNDGLEREMEITLPANDINARIASKLKEVGKTVRLPGFRPGKVPMNILEQKYRKVIMGEVLESAVHESSAQALREKELRPALQPKIEVTSFDDGKDLVYVMKFETLPKFEVQDFKGMKLQKLVSKPDAKTIDEAIDKIAANRKQAKPIETPRATKKDDVVVMDFEGRTADDNKVHPGMKAEKYTLELGSGAFIPGFEDQLIGQKTGEKIEVRVGFPADYGAKELAGRDAIFDVTIHEIREPVDAVINDDFAKSFGMEDLAALRKAVEEQLVKEFEHHSRLYLKKGLMDRLDETHDFTVPQGMRDLEFTNITDQLELERQRNPEQAAPDDAEKEEFREIAERRVRLGLILSEIGNKNNITVSDAELQRAVIAEAQRHPGQERAVFDYYAKNRNALESMRAPLFEDKVVDFILAMADVSEKEVSPDELVNAIESEEKALAEKKPAKKSSKKEAGSKSAAPKAAAKKSA